VGASSSSSFPWACKSDNSEALSLSALAAIGSSLPSVAASGTQAVVRTGTVILLADANGIDTLVGKDVIPWNGGAVGSTAFNGSAIAWSVNDSLLVTTVAGGTTQLLLEAGESINYVAMDGSDIYYALQSTVGIWKVPLVGGTPAHINSTLTTQYLRIEDGKLYASDFTTSKVYQVDRVSGATTAVSLAVGFVGPFALDEQNIYVGSYGNLYESPLANKSEYQLIAKTSGQAWINDVAAHTGVVLIDWNGALYRLEPAQEKCGSYTGVSDFMGLALAAGSDAFWVAGNKGLYRIAY